MQCLLYPQKFFQTSILLSRTNAIISNLSVSFKYREQDGPSLQDILPVRMSHIQDSKSFKGDFSFSKEIFHLAVRYLNDEWEYAKPAKKCFGPKRKIAYSFNLRIIFMMPAETNSLFAAGGKRKVAQQNAQKVLHQLLDQPYGRNKLPTVKQEEAKEEEFVDVKNVLLTQKRNLDDQLKKLKVKIKKLKRKGLGPAQEVMLETWTINTDKLKTEIQEITAKINELSPAETSQTDRFQSEALSRWKVAITEWKNKPKVPQTEVQKSHLILREMLGALDQVEQEIKAKHAERREIKNFSKIFHNEWNSIIQEEQKFQQLNDGKCKLEQVVHLTDPNLQPAVDALFAQFKDHYVVFEEGQGNQDHNYLFVEQFDDYANLAYDYEATPFLKRIFDFLQFDPRLSGLVGFIFKNYGVVTVNEKEVHTTLVKDGYSFIDPFNSIIYHKEGHMKLVELKALSQIHKLSPFMVEQRRLNKKTDNTVKFLKQAEIKLEAITAAVKQRQRALVYLSKLIFKAQVEVEEAFRKFKQFIQTHQLTLDKLLNT